MSAQVLREAASAIRKDATALSPSASWHPAVALAVAAGLDAVAEHADQVEAFGVNPAQVERIRPWLTVARAYLNDPP